MNSCITHANQAVVATIKGVSAGIVCAFYDVKAKFVESILGLFGVIATFSILFGPLIFTVYHNGGTLNHGIGSAIFVVSLAFAVLFAIWWVTAMVCRYHPEQFNMESSCNEK